MYEISYGAKYQKGLDVKEIAKLYRKEVAEGVKAGTLPKGLKLSVKIERYAGGRSINVKIVSAGELLIKNPERFKLEIENPHQYIDGGRVPFYTEGGKKLLETLKSMLQAYNFDGSEIQSDYFHVNFYGDVTVSWELEKAEKEAFLAKVEMAKLLAPQPAA